MDTLAIRFDYGGAALCEKSAAARRVADILVEPCFSGCLRRVSAKRLDRWVGHKRASATAIAETLLDRRNEAASLDNGRSGELIASAEIDCGPMVRPKGPPLSRYMAALVVPLVSAQRDELTRAVCDLAIALDVAAGFVALDSRYGLAHRIALGGARPLERVGLSDQRRRERQGRAWKDDLLHTHVSGIEWMTVLGPGHLEAMATAGPDLDMLHAVGVFHRVIDIVPGRIVGLQLTPDPADEFADVDLFETKLAAARAALAPVMLDVADVSLD
jgi:hypothetical protein